MQPRVLMCRPDHFSVEYEINDWMDKTIQPDKFTVSAEWLSLFDFYKKLGIKIDLIPQIQGLPDMVFTANAGLVYNNTFISSNFFHEERQAERGYFTAWFSKQNFKIEFLPKDVYFEGQGDAVWFDKNTLLLGYGRRTSESAIDSLGSILKDCKIIPLEMVRGARKEFYHLDTVLCYLKKINGFLVYSEAFSHNSLRRLEQLGKIIEVTYQEAEWLTCNSVNLAKQILMPEGGNDRVRKILQKKGYKIFNFSMNEFLKSGGAIRCLSFFY